jgi:sugar lactone lactonase YvrE
MMRSPFECVLDIEASLGECPTWSVDEQSLFWVDINAPSLNRFDPLTGRNTVWPMPEAIGCFALREGGRFVAALRSGIWSVDSNGRPKSKIVAAPYDPANYRFNDGRADAQGRFWAGSMNEKRDSNSAQLYRLDTKLNLTSMISGIMVSNGLAWSPDSLTMYHADTPTRSITAWDFDPLTGDIANRRVFAQFPGEYDRPDGGVVDREGCYWSAFYGGGKVVRLSPRGETMAEFPLPAMCPTMCAFGGPDLKTLYVTTARQRRDKDELLRLPQSGGIFAMRVDVPGLPESKFAG